MSATHFAAPLPPDEVIRRAIALRKKDRKVDYSLTATREELQAREITRLAKELVAWQHAELARRARRQKGRAA